MSEPPVSGVPRPVSAADEQAADTGLRSGIRLARRRAAPAPASPHAERFRLAGGVLGILAIGAITMAIIAASGGRPATKAWSAFKPQFSGVAGAREIANYISPGYRISPTQQLAVVTISSSLNGATVVLKEGPTNADTGVLTGNTLVYQMCGLGPSCSIPGKPSTTRLLLTRLEAFELALYSLHYLNVDNVVSILPPAVQQVAGSTSGGTGSLSATPPTSLGKTIVAVEFNRQELQPLLSEPVTSLFPTRPPALGGVPSSQAIATMDYLSANQLFTPSAQTGQDGTQYLVLSQLPAQ
ncbi:MAG TPA: hypothetical protein VG186_16030 [Solirubrobacteraceae bacterium]|jgi:hypothetical protein|nr:hypothetical protein [Solirubrobacteraceae bacterium]